METFAFKNLVPDWCQLPISTINNHQFCADAIASPAESISTLIISLLIIITASVFIYTLRKFFNARSLVTKYFKLLKGVEQSDLAEKRLDIRNKAEKNSDYFSRLWREFDESLILHKDDNAKYRLSNTLDAAHFFNTSSLSRGLTENRFLAAIPGLLTAIGVIGTFAGLQMGLAGIDLSGNDVSQLKEGIRNMIQGASIAFLTSLWGIGLSVLFNLVEKMMERSVRSRIGNLQNRIDFLFPRINAEQSLVDIASTNKVGAETMLGLAEQIGDRLQKAMIDAGESISTGLKSSLHEILAPALAKLATDAQTGSEKALEGLVENFMQGIGQAGKEQRDLMDASSSEMKAAVGQLGSEMTQFIASLEEQSLAVDEKNAQQRAQIEKMLVDGDQKIGDRQKIMASQFEDLMGGISRGVTDQLEAQTERDHLRMQSFKTQLHQVTEHQKAAVNEFTAGVTQKLDEQRDMDRQRSDRADLQARGIQSSQEALGTRLESLLAFQEQSHKELYESLGTLQLGFQEVVNVNRDAAENVKGSSENMRSASALIERFGTKINDAAVALGEMVDRATKSTLELADSNREAISRLDEVLNQYKQFAGEVSATTEALREATAHAETGLSSVGTHLKDFQHALQSQVTELEKQMQALMEDFATRVNTQTAERLQVWTDETSKYSSVMSGAINAIADVVDDIEDRVGTR